MVTFDNLDIEGLTLQLITQSESKFTGRMEIVTSKGVKWDIYLGLGRVVWATGGSHPHRRWQRLLVKYCSQPQSQPTIRGQDQFEAWDYHVLSILVKRNQVPLERVKLIITDLFEEILFDLYQRSVQKESIFAIRWDLGIRPSQQQVLPPHTIVSPELSINQVREIWKGWQEAGIGSVFPDLAPVIKNSAELKQLIPLPVYQNLQRVIDGQRSLRDVALVMKLDLMKLVKVLFPYLRRGMIDLIAVADVVIQSENRQNPESRTTPENRSTPERQKLVPRTNINNAHAPLIVCVDDSKQICEEMEYNLTQAGYRFIGLQDSVMALATLLEAKPDLIFLDLIMPVANGYEICAQIRRISLFHDTPVVILTGNDGLVDRVRAKMVGATDFLTKPAKPEKLLATIQKYIKAAPS